MIIDSKQYEGLCACGRTHKMETTFCVIESGCLKNLGDYMKQNGVQGYKKIENGVVGGYQKIETGAVEGFNKVVDKCVEVLFVREGESVEEAKARLSGKEGK